MITLRWLIPSRNAARLFTAAVAQGNRRTRPSALAQARVLIVGLGGLGSPVMQYLAGAGVGLLGLVDADILDASNLHRQPIYALADIGKPKVDLARAAIARHQPAGAGRNSRRSIQRRQCARIDPAYDIVVDCSDNFRTKYLINDAAVLAQRPAVFASVYQYEGQLQVYKPEPRARLSALPVAGCHWPTAWSATVPKPASWGPCPDVSARCRRCWRLKILLRMSGQLEGELLLLDFMNFSSTEASRRRAAPSAVRQRARISSACRVRNPISRWRCRSLCCAAAARGLEVIDIRTAEEFAAQPITSRHIPMQTLLADPELLESGTRGAAGVRIGQAQLGGGARVAQTRSRGALARSAGLQKLGALSCDSPANCPTLAPRYSP